MKHLSFKLSLFETILLCCSLTIISVCYIFIPNRNWLSLIASLIGITAVLYVSKGNVIGQVLTVIFAILYSIISWKYKYFGELITYAFMCAPMAIVSITSWFRHPYKDNHSEVEINSIKAKEWVFLAIIAILVTIAFYFILKAFNTANLIVSTISILTSFFAGYLTFRRSEFYAVAYASNDIVLIVLWILASIDNPGYISMIICFCIFLINDLYGFYNWQKLKKKQSN